MKTDIVFENLKVGQKLYSLTIGEVEITELGNSDYYPITCRGIDADNELDLSSFTKEGKQLRYHNLPTLFLTNPFEKTKERVIEVNNCGNWNKRVLIKTILDVAIVWEKAETIEEAKLIGNVASYSKDLWRELQTEQPTQPKEITLDGVEYVLTPKVK